MDKVQIHPTGFLDPADPSNPSKILAPEALRGSGALLITKQGKRFANELGTRGYLTNMIERYGDINVKLLTGRDQKTVIMILNEEVGIIIIKFFSTLIIYVYIIIACVMVLLLCTL